MGIKNHPVLDLPIQGVPYIGVYPILAPYMGSNDHPILELPIRGVPNTHDSPYIDTLFWNRYRVDPISVPYMGIKNHPVSDLPIQGVPYIGIYPILAPCFGANIGCIL